jgi:hypothetical protein
LSANISHERGRQVDLEVVGEVQEQIWEVGENLANNKEDDDLRQECCYFVIQNGCEGIS